MKQKLKKRIGLILCISILFNILLPLLNLFSGQVLAKDDKDGKKLAQYIGEFLREIWISKLTEFDNSELDKEDATVEFTLYGLGTKQEESGNFSNLNLEGKVYKSKGMFLWPTPGYTKITSEYGYRIHPTKKIKKLHTGVDIEAPAGATVYAAADGEVKFAEFNRKARKRSETLEKDMEM